MNLEAYLKNAKICVGPGSFAIVKAKAPNAKAFVNISDGREVTVILTVLSLYHRLAPPK